MNWNVRKYISGVGAVIFPAIHFYLLEAYTHSGFTTVRPWSQLFNIIIFEMIALILFFLFGNVKWALRTEGIVAMIIGLINYYVYTFRSLPLVPWDVLSLGTAFRVADNYNFMPTLRVVAVMAGFILILYLEGLCDWKLRKWKWYQNLVSVVVGSVLLVAFAGVLQQEEFQNKHKMYNKLFTPVHMWQVNGFVLTTVMELPYLSIDKPKGYDKKEVQEFLKNPEGALNEVPGNNGINGVLPNIIVIMDEAFSDLGVLGEFTPSEAYMPYVHNILDGAKNTVSGTLNVSVCGGNTANTEFEFLTGNTMAFLPQGSIPYQQYINEEIPALPAYLKELGYETYGMHPYYANGWERDSVYPMLGFEHLEFIGDYWDREYIRDYVSDRSCMNKIITTFEYKDPKTPMFVFNVTMQNHGSYGEIHENFVPHITVEGISSNSLSNYLSLIQKTDEAVEELISYFSKVEEPTMVVFFGDHQPNDTVAEPILRLNGMSYRTLSEEETKLRYQVPYFIWTNYDSETIKNTDTSVNYLGSMVLEAAGIELPAYQKFLKEFQKEYPIISAVRIEGEQNGSERLDEYKKLQYYQLFDSQN